MVKSHCIYTCIKSSKEYCVLCVKNIARLHKCLHVMTIWDMRKSLYLTHNHNYLMMTITFKVHPIASTSQNTRLQSYIKYFDSFYFLFFFAYFFFKQTVHGHIRDRKEILNDIKHLTFHLCYAEAYNFMIGGQQWWNGYICLSLRIF